MAEQSNPTMGQLADDFFADVAAAIDWLAALAPFAFNTPDIDPSRVKKFMGFCIVCMVALVGISANKLMTPKSENAVIAIEKDDDIRAALIAKTSVDPALLKEMGAKHPEMQYIPAGPVLIGPLDQEFVFTDDDGKAMAQTGQKPAHEVNIKGFYIDRFEFPNGDLDPYAPPNMQIPAPLVTGLDFGQAASKCASRGKRLCSSQEWEKACKGPSNLIYSYGDGYDADQCGDGQEYKINSKDSCYNGYGVYGMSGGPREWTSSQPNRDASQQSYRVIKGGSLGKIENSRRCAYSYDEPENAYDFELSFRCCMDAG
jgi:formylglycine-generating enzyme required for sulfatase activity